MSSIQTLRYHITSDSHILLNEQFIYKEQTVQQWDVGIRKGEKKGWYMSIDVFTLPQTDQPASKPFHGLLELLNQPTNRLELLFDDHWHLWQIMNKKEIFVCWEEVQKKISAQLGDSNEVRQMLKERESAITNLETELFESIGHVLLLNAFRRDKSIRFFTSSILSSESELDVRLSVWEEGGKDGQLSYKGEGVLSSLSALKKTYNRQIKSYAGDAELAYRYDMQMDYQFDATNGILQEATATITEQVSERYKYHHRLNFRRVEVNKP